MNLSELELDHLTEGSERYVNLTIMIMPVEKAAPELALITAHDGTDQVALKKRLEAVQREHADLVGELTAANNPFTTIAVRLCPKSPSISLLCEPLCSLCLCG